MLVYQRVPAGKAIIPQDPGEAPHLDGLQRLHVQHVVAIVQRRLLVIEGREAHALEVAPIAWTGSATCVMSLDWFKGKSTGNHGFYHQIWGVPVNFPIIQFYDDGSVGNKYGKMGKKMGLA